MKKQYQNFPSTDVRKAIEDTEREYGLLNFILMIIGLALLIGGFIVMNYANSDASNIPAFLSPTMIISAIIIIVFSLLIDPDFSNEE